MEQLELQLGILSAQNLKNVNMSGKITAYAVAWDFPNIKVSTTIDPTGSVNTTWNPLCLLTVQKWILQQQNANVQIDISSRGIISNNHVGSCSVPLSHFQEMDSEGADTEKVISLPVHTPAGGPHGMLHLSLKLGDVYQPSAMPGASSAVAHTVEPNNNNPILAYSAGYPNGSNQVGGSQYLQNHPQHPQSDPLVTGPQYSPLAFQYAFPPLPQHPQYAFPPLPQHPQSYPVQYAAPPPPQHPQYAFPPLPQHPQSYPVQYAAPPPPQRTGLFGGGFARTFVSAAQGALVIAELANTIGGSGYGGGGGGWGD